MVDELTGLSPEEEKRILAEAQAILDASGFAFRITGLTVRSKGVMGDAPTYLPGLVIEPQSLAACDTEVQGRLCTKIINEVRGINRTLFEIRAHF